MRRTRVKICGLTRPEDAAAAVAAGADALGVVFAASPRRVSIAQAEEVLANVGPFVARVGLFVDAELDAVFEAVARCGLTAVQFCGSETPEVCAAAPVPVMKTLPVGEDFTWERAKPYEGIVSALVLDAYVPGLAGGTARTFAWESALNAPDWVTLIVAGGLRPSNVAECVAALRPFGVDVSSGVESSLGVKDHSAIEAFCAAVRAADEEVSTR